MPSRETTALVFGLTRTAVGVIIIYCKYSCQSRLYACWLVCQWCNIAPHTTEQLFHKNENQFSHSLSCQAWNMFNIPYCRQCQVSLFGNVKCHFLSHFSSVSCKILSRLRSRCTFCFRGRWSNGKHKTHTDFFHFSMGGTWMNTLASSIKVMLY